MRIRGTILLLVLLTLAANEVLAQKNQADPPKRTGFDLLDALTPPILNLEIYDEKGKPVHMLSEEAYRAEFRYLRRVYHEMDLKGPPVQTDGWTYNISEAEWPVMGLCYFGYGCAELAVHDPLTWQEALKEMRWVIEAVQTPRISGFMKPHFGEPFGKEKINPSVFLHGHFLNVAMRYREVSGDARYDKLIHRVAQALLLAYSNDDQGILRSYPDMWWITDNLPALSALARYDRVFKKDTSTIRKKFLKSLKTHYLDEKTGMICTYVHPPTHRRVQEPRGISQMYALHFLRDIDPEFSKEQYALAKKHLVREALGLAAVREFPEGSKETSDIDSGPVVLGLGPSASGFAIGASVVMEDWSTNRSLLEASVVVGMPVFQKGEIHYLAMPIVGQAIVFFGKTLTLHPNNSKSR
jgi:hypothetical protein